MPTPFRPTAEQLHRGVEHVCYEYANLRSAAYFSLHGEAPWRTHADDAFLLGYRKLADFLLYDRRSRRGPEELPDILAKDYLPPDLSRSWALPCWSADWASPMDKQLAHLSYVRDKDWDHTKWVRPLTREMCLAWAQFLASVAPPHRTEFDRQLDIRRNQPGLRRIGL